MKNVLWKCLESSSTRSRTLNESSFQYGANTVDNCFQCSTFRKKIWGPAGPQVFIFGRQNKYSDRQKLYLRINGM